MTKMMNSGIIYKATHNESGKAYIGITRGDLETRKRDHEQKGAKSTGYQFQEAIGTYGPEAFSWSQIDTANSIEELAEKEKQYIVKYDSKENGYNSDSGGGFKKPVYKFSTNDGLLLSHYDGLESAANTVSGTRKGISAACLGKRKTYKGYYWSYSLTIPFGSQDDKRMKRISQYLLGNKLKCSFLSISEASIATGVGKSCIAKCCRGERTSAGGYLWGFEI